jgi:hypothetical protein
VGYVVIDCGKDGRQECCNAVEPTVGTLKLKIQDMAGGFFRVKGAVNGFGNGHSLGIALEMKNAVACGGPNRFNVDI